MSSAEVYAEFESAVHTVDVGGRSGLHVNLFPPCKLLTAPSLAVF